MVKFISVQTKFGGPPSKEPECDGIALINVDTIEAIELREHEEDVTFVRFYVSNLCVNGAYESTYFEFSYHQAVKFMAAVLASEDTVLNLDAEADAWARTSKDD
jgi:hypothetical protein